eukprot:6434824-Prymnesium_polylepis.1
MTKPPPTPTARVWSIFGRSEVTFVQHSPQSAVACTRCHGRVVRGCQTFAEEAGWLAGRLSADTFLTRALRLGSLAYGL